MYHDLHIKKDDNGNPKMRMLVYLLIYSNIAVKSVYVTNT